MGRALARTGLAVGALSAAWLVTRSGRAERVERVVSDLVRAPRTATIERAVSIATELGSTFAVAGAAAAIAFSGRRDAAVDVVAAGAIAWTAAQAVKPFVRRARPYEAGHADRLVAVPAGSAWPSGHPAVAAAVATVLTDRLSPRARTVASTIVGAVAVSRVYVGVHHPSDVIAGVALGVLVGDVTRVVADRTRRGRARRG